MENCCCCPANCGELRPGLLVLMPDAMGLPPGFIGLLALAIGFPRTCKQKEWLSPRSVPEVAWTKRDEKRKEKEQTATGRAQQREAWGILNSPQDQNGCKGEG